MLKCVYCNLFPNTHKYGQTPTHTHSRCPSRTHNTTHVHHCIPRIAFPKSESQSSKRTRRLSLCFPPKVYHALTLPQSRPRPTPTAQLGAPKSGNVRRLALSRCSTVAEIATLLEFDFDFGFSQSQKTALYAFRPKTHNSRSRLALTNQQKIRKKSGKKFYIL